MSEPKVTREEMLDLLFDIEQEWVHQILSLHERLATGQRLTKEERGKLRRLEWGVQKKQKILHAIRRLIEHGPEVSREFVEKWEAELSEWATECPRRDGMVKAMLTELGHEVEK